MGQTDSPLEAELAYYRRLVDELGSQLLTLEYRAWGLAERLADLHHAFALIAQLQSEMGAVFDLDLLRSRLVSAIATRMRLDRTLLLEPNEDGSGFMPAAWSGFPLGQSQRFKDRQCILQLRADMMDRTLLVHSNTPVTPVVEILRTFLGLKFFVFVPLVADNVCTSALLVARARERLPDYPPFDSADVDTYETVAGILRTAELYQSELQRRVEFERERLRISRDMHDEIGSSLTKIAILSERVMKENVSAHVHSLLSRISGSSREVIDCIGDIIWAINPANDALDDLVSYIRSYTSEFLQLADLPVTVDIQDEFPEVLLSAEARRNLFLVVKEALNNIVRHAAATCVAVRIHIVDNGMEISIIDDGRGFDTDAANAQRTGLTSMRKRIEHIGGTFQLISKTGNGTSVSITFPIFAGIQRGMA